MSAIWTSQLLHSLTSLCNIPSSSHLHGFRVDSDLQGNKDLISLTVVFKKPFLHSPKYKSPSTIRHNQQRRQNWLLQRSTTNSLASQAGNPSSRPSQVDSGFLSHPLLIPTINKNAVLSFVTTSESKVVSNSNVSSGTSSRHSNSASLPETPPQASELMDMKSSSSTTTHPIHTNASPNTILPPNHHPNSFPGPPVASSSLNDGTVDRKFPTASLTHSPASPSTSNVIHMSIDAPIQPDGNSIGRKRGRSLTPPPPSQAVDPHASLHQKEASTRSESLSAITPAPSSLQPIIPTAQSTTQSKHVAQDTDEDIRPWVPWSAPDSTNPAQIFFGYHDTSLKSSSSPGVSAQVFFYTSASDARFKTTIHNGVVYDFVETWPKDKQIELFVWLSNLYNTIP